MSEPEYIDPVVFAEALKKQQMEKTLEDLINPPPPGPKYTFKADGETGMYRAQDDVLRISVGGKPVGEIIYEK